MFNYLEKKINFILVASSVKLSYSKMTEEKTVEENDELIVGDPRKLFTL